MEATAVQQPIGDVGDVTAMIKAAMEAMGVAEPTQAFNDLYRQIRELGLERNIAELDAFGYTTIPDAAPLAFFDRLRARLLELAAEDRAHGIETFGGYGTLGQTVFHLLDRGRVFEEAVLNAKLVALMTYLLGRSYVVSTLTGMIRGQGAQALPLHSDNQFMPQPFPPYSQVATAIWCCEDFSAERGAIRFVPGSHRYLRHPVSGEGESRAIPLVCPKGTVALWSGNTWHGNCARTVPGERVTLHTAFSRAHLRPMESYEGCFSQEVIERNGPLFAQLVGRDLPYGFDAKGPDPLKMARLAFTTMSLA